MKRKRCGSKEESPLQQFRGREETKTETEARERARREARIPRRPAINSQSQNGIIQIGCRVPSEREAFECLELAPHSPSLPPKSQIITSYSELGDSSYHKHGRAIRQQAWPASPIKYLTGYCSLVMNFFTSVCIPLTTSRPSRWEKDQCLGATPALKLSGTLS